MELYDDAVYVNSDELYAQENGIVAIWVCNYTQRKNPYLFFEGDRGDPFYEGLLIVRGVFDQDLEIRDYAGTILATFWPASQNPIQSPELGYKKIILRKKTRGSTRFKMGSKCQ